MFVRVWKYRVHLEYVDAFERAYGPEGDWALLFDRSPGFEGTRLFRDCSDGAIFVTVDTWSDKSHWDLFIGRWKTEYYRLDETLAYLTIEDYELLTEQT